MKFQRQSHQGQSFYRRHPPANEISSSFTATSQSTARQSISSSCTLPINLIKLYTANQSHQVVQPANQYHQVVQLANQSHQVVKLANQSHQVVRPADHSHQVVKLANQSRQAIQPANQSHQVVQPANQYHQVVQLPINLIRLYR